MIGKLSRSVKATIGVGSPWEITGWMISLPHESRTSSLGLLSSKFTADATNKTVFAILTTSKVANVFPCGGITIEKRCLNLGRLLN